MTTNDFAMEEYRALRAEIIQSMNDGNQVMTFGLGTIGLVYSAVLSIENTPFDFYVLVLGLPSLTSLIMTYWFAAQERIAKASHYLSGTEHRVKTALGATADVSWEAWIRMQKTRHGSPWRSRWTAELSAICLFLLIAISSFLVGLGRTHGVIGVAQTWTIALFSIALNGALGAHVRRRYKNWAHWLRTSYDPNLWSDFQSTRHS